MNWLALSVQYGIVVLIALFLWNRQLHVLLTLWVLLSVVCFPACAFFGLPLACGIAFPLGILVSLLGWWYSAELVKPRYIMLDWPRLKVRLFRNLSITLIAILHIVLILLPVAILADWKTALVIAGVNVLAWMKAGAVSTDRYVLQRAKEIHDEEPECSFEDALIQGEREARFNVDKTDFP